MFGYVTINQEDLKVRDLEKYRSYYCGLCQSLKERYGFKGQILLPNDLVFLDVLLNGLYEMPQQEKDVRCAVHPFKKRHVRYNSITDYCADMGVLLAYYKLLDDIYDENSKKAELLLSRLKKSAEQVIETYPRQAKAVADGVSSLEKCEQEAEASLDRLAACTGGFLGEIFVYHEDMWSDTLRRMAFFLGKYVYLLDGYVDLDKDNKNGAFNPWRKYQDRPDFDALVENTLTMMMAECAKSFEILPIVQDADLLRNIIYSGVWTKFAEAKRKREEKGDES